ncbi:hypothetical protein [Devosia sp.]|uniref:hypothetical protein n=1 Tax=Devosia sp. TaxID=1871048 RepID=UPI003A8E29C7
MKQILTIFATAGLALALGFGASGPVAAQECLDKRQAQQMTNSGRAMQLSDALAAAGETGKPISSVPELCKVNGRWVWRVSILKGYGAEQVTLPAE